ncbi:hypothetical protein BASA81_005124 [Batrachochytrium salamandrivorans]|nr:hypothetical protein BASA81_005124 [Batrachochytrium salamandrivorans]
MFPMSNSDKEAGAEKVFLLRGRVAAPTTVYHKFPNPALPLAPSLPMEYHAESPPPSSSSPLSASGAATGGDSSSRSRGNWTKEEDQLLRDLVGQYGLKKWAVIATKLPSGRIGKQCRERWVNHLDVYVKKAPWTNEEDNVLIQGQKKLGNKWCAISKLLVGRPENAVKNRWNSIVNRLKHQQMREEEMTTFSPPTRVAQLLTSVAAQFSTSLSSSNSPASVSASSAMALGGVGMLSPPPPPPLPSLFQAPLPLPSLLPPTINQCAPAEEELFAAFTSLQRTKLETLQYSQQQQTFELEALEGICALKRMPKA